MTGRSIVLLYGPTWDAPSQVSKHHLARHWARQGNKVLYLEAPFHPFSLATRPREVRRLWNRFLTGPHLVEPNLWVQVCPTLYPYRAGWPLAGARWALGLNHTIVRRRVRTVCRRLGFHLPMVVVSTVTGITLLEALKPSLVMYHCSDDYGRQPTFPSSFLDLERDLVARCGLVVCTSEALRQAKAHMHPHTHAVANGADVEHFALTQAPETQVAQDLRDLPRPVVGYIGIVFRWVDQAMIADAATRHPDWSFVFVGPITTDVGRLRSFQNVHFLGPRPYDRLPSYLKGFDVATVPFIEHDVTLRASPVKFYEYLSSGVPIVATRLPDFEPFIGLANLVSTPQEFTAALEEAVSEDTPHKCRDRMVEARNHSWDARFARVDRLIEEAFERESKLRTQAV